MNQVLLKRCGASVSPCRLPTRRAIATSSPPDPSATPLPPPPRPSIFTLQTLYPFLLLSTMTSLALNLSHSRSSLQTERGRMEAQISVLERILARGGEWTEREERELELVGLGRAKLAGYGKLNGEEEERGRTGWREVFFGKKGKEFADDEASEGTDWEKLFNEADAEAKRVQSGQPSTPSEAAVAVTPTPTTSSPLPTPAPRRTVSNATYL